jgi:hypothetical protein
VKYIGKWFAGIDDQGREGSTSPGGAGRQSGEECPLDNPGGLFIKCVV